MPLRHCTAAVFGRWKIIIHESVKALVPIRMSVMWKFYIGNRPEKHLSVNSVYQTQYKTPPNPVPLAHRATSLRGFVLNRSEVLPNLSAYRFKRHSLAICCVRIALN